MELEYPFVEINFNLRYSNSEFHDYLLMFHKKKKLKKKPIT